MTFLGASLAGKNLLATLLTAVPIGAIAGMAPQAMSFDSFFWGAMGGVCRTMAEQLTGTLPKQPHRMALHALINVLVSGLFADGISDLITPDVVRQLSDWPASFAAAWANVPDKNRDFLSGLLFVAAFGLISDYINARKRGSQ